MLAGRLGTWCIYIKIHWTDLKDYSYFPSFGSLRTVKFTSDAYTNNTFQGFCWQLLLSCEFLNILTITDH